MGTIEGEPMHRVVRLADDALVRARHMTDEVFLEAKSKTGRWTIVALPDEKRRELLRALMTEEERAALLWACARVNVDENEKPIHGVLRKIGGAA